jgi:hypothetical protein
MTTPSEQELLARIGEIPEAGAGTARSAPRLPKYGFSPGRTLTRRGRVLALVASSVWVAINLALFGLRPDVSTLPLPYLEAAVVVPYLLALTCLAVALAPGRLGLGVSVGVLGALTVLGPSSFFLIGAAAPVLHAPAPGSSALEAAGVCLGLSLAWSALPLALARTTLRGAFPAASGWRSALVGAAAGLCAGATIDLHCPNVAPFHLLVGHGLPVLAALSFGAVALSRSARA